MRVVQINSVCGRGSTGRIAVDIARQLEQQGHECYIAYGHGTTDYEKSYRIGGRWGHLWHNAFFSRLLGLQGYGSRRSTRRFVKWLATLRPDVVHIHNLHANYINFNILYRYLAKSGIPVVITLHDCLNFTGKCTHFTAAGCDKWKRHCGGCPLYRCSGVPSLFFDRSAKIFADKKRAYASLRSLSSFGVSRWLASLAAGSILNTAGHNVEYIYNWVDYNVFRPASDADIADFMRAYGLDDAAKYLVSVSQRWQRGSTRLADALSLSAKLPEGYKLILVGSMDAGQALPGNVVQIPYISSPSALAAAYSLAEAYVHLSVQDTFGLVTAEAMACGTIPITFDSTACSETHAGFGITVPPRDIDAIAGSLPLLPEKRKHAAEMMQYVRQHYDKETNINRYIEVYNQLTQK